uniref:Uncharacterized protein n=1 Tax=Thermosporothrix sp. COM3 TaxID=2490863 RepID=A0A455SBR3_9CHLR|nr:hypothetical protein KTC_06480 [Thermosporothrix sp. COM3]
MSGFPRTSAPFTGGLLWLPCPTHQGQLTRAPVLPDEKRSPFDAYGISMRNQLLLHVVDGII